MFGLRALYAIAFLFLLPLFAGCQITLRDEYGRYPYNPDPVEDPIGNLNEAERERQALKVTMAVYPNNFDSRPEVGGKSPFGVMVGFGKPGVVSYCSVSHLSRGRVVTAAHCFPKDPTAGDNYFVFFDAAGRKKVTRGNKFIFMGNEDEGDIALLEVDNRSRDWDTAEAIPQDTQAERDVAIGTATHKVSIWSFDPSDPGGERMMSFRPRTCVMGRTVPHILNTFDDATVVKQEFKEKYKSEAWLFYDECDADTMNGNSGGLVSEFNDFRKVHGVHHGTRKFVPTDRSDIVRREIVMPSGKKRTLTVGTENLMFRMSAPLDYINFAQPGTL